MIVANTTPLINFAAIKELRILEQLFGQVVIPEEVAIELLEKGDSYASAIEIRRVTFLQRQAIQNVSLFQTLCRELDAGEAAAIVLALEQNANLLILDEIAGRNIARFHGVLVVGSIGCLVEAKKQGIIPVIKPYLQAMKEQARFWISDSLYQTVLDDAGEN